MRPLPELFVAARGSGEVYRPVSRNRWVRLEAHDGDLEVTIEFWNGLVGFNYTGSRKYSITPDGDVARTDTGSAMVSSHRHDGTLRREAYCLPKEADLEELRSVLDEVLPR